MNGPGEVFQHPGVNCERTTESFSKAHSGTAEGDRTFQTRVLGEGLAAVALGLREVAAAIRYYADADRTVGPRSR